jgi:CBS domain containing-hemolysin-like protein
MSPRTELIAIEFIWLYSRTEKNYLSETGYSKVVVYQNSLDDIVGYVHSFDLFKKLKK